MLDEIYANSLTVLYRLLFVLHAEARELLPLRESTLYCEEYSLYTIVRQAAKRIDSGLPLLQDSAHTWTRLSLPSPNLVPRNLPGRLRIAPPWRSHLRRAGRYRKSLILYPRRKGAPP